MSSVDGELAFLLGRTVQAASADAVEVDGVELTMADLTLAFDDGLVVMIEGAQGDTLMMTVTDG